MIDLQFAPLDEFTRVRSLDAPPVARARLFADLCRLNALYMITRAGSGHIGSSFSCLDIVSWLYLHELRDPASGASDVFYSSKGHDVPGLYSVLIALGRLPFDRIHTLRRLDGLPGHPDVSIPAIEANTGSLGMGISKAKGIALANRLHGRDGRTYVLTGDGELQEGQFWESLVSAANHGLSGITAIVDHNKLQSDTFVARVSDLGDLEAKFASFGWHVARVDGHDPAAIEAALAGARADEARPSVIIADTVKGKGVSFMEPGAPGTDPDLYGFHSGAPADEVYLRAVAEIVERVNRDLAELGQPALRTETAPRPPRPAPAQPQRLVAAYSRALVEHAARDARIVAFDADLVLDTGLVPFRKQFPDRFVECGIAEQDMVSQAGAAARRGLLPVVHSFACFLSSRPNEQIYNNATERSKVVYVGSLAGLVPGGPGHSHQCVRDISSLAAVPGLVLLEPCCDREVTEAVDYCLARTSESTYLRLVTVPTDVPFALPAAYRLEEGRGVTLREGGDAVIIGYGPVLLAEAWKAAERLQAEHGIGVRVVNLPWLNRVDADWLREAVAGVRWVFTLDNHYVTGGQGEMLLCALAEHGLSAGIRARRLGVLDVPACGTNDEVLRAHGLDAAGLAATMAAAMGTPAQAPAS
ncbi:MAG: transketolase C-terminal domain-containing protein [Vicinamibacterales bacterium]